MTTAQIGHNSQAKPGNWITVSREMRDHPIVGMGKPVTPADPKRGAYSRYEAWQDLLMEAKFRETDVSNKGKIVRLNRGQLMAARAWLAHRWNWTEKTVRAFLDRLEGEFMIRRESGQQKGQQISNKVNIITVCNYDIYQLVTELMTLTEGQQKGQPGASQGPESKKEILKQESESPPQTPSPEPARVNVVGEIGGLNGATSLIVDQLAKWISPTMPDKRTARAAIENFVSLYSGPVVRDAFAELEAKMLHGDIIARPIPYLAQTCRRYADSRKSASQQSYSANGTYVGPLL